MSKWIVLASLATALVSPALAGVAPAPGGGQQAMSGAKVAPVKKPEQEQQHGKEQPEGKQDEHK